MVLWFCPPPTETLSQHGAQKATCAIILRIAEHRLGATLLHNAAAIEKAHPIGDLACEAHFVSDQQHREIMLMRERADHLLHLAHELRIEG